MDGKMGVVQSYTERSGKWLYNPSRSGCWCWGWVLVWVRAPFLGALTTLGIYVCSDTPPTFPSSILFSPNFTYSFSISPFLNPNPSPSFPAQTPTMDTLFFLFLFSFFAIYIFAYFLLFPNWSPKIRPEASSCVISFFHGTPAVILATLALLYDDARGFSSPNTHFQSIVLDYSIAYFCTDLIHYLVFFPHDVLFIGHHLATLFVFVTCRYLVAHGAFAVLTLLILAELTSACQNTWTLANARRQDVEFAGKVYRALSPPFYALYSVVRGILGPLFVYKMCVFFVSGAADHVIPKWVWISWTVVIVSAISVSILWVSGLWLQLFRERSGILDKKTT